MGLFWKVTAVLAVVLAGCGGDADPPSDRFALLADESWILKEAREVADDDPIATIAGPEVDWYAEYERQSAQSSELIVVSGHPSSLHDTRSEYEALGFAFDAVEVTGWNAVAGTQEVDPVGPSMLLLEHGDASISALSYELEPAELAALAESIEPANEAEWVESGGAVL